MRAFAIFVLGPALIFYLFVFVEFLREGKRTVKSEPAKPNRQRITVAKQSAAQGVAMFRRKREPPSRKGAA